MALACLPICAACSTSVKAPPQVYVGIPAALMARCVVQDITMDTVGDVVTSRARYKEAFERCAAKVDAIRAHDAQASAAVGNSK